MAIKLVKLEVDGGFLSGLDMEFADGLNVLIGARGAGKTSVVEVIRFCLGIEAVSTSAQTRATEHAQSVLGDGTATLTVDVDGVERVMRRSGQEDPSVGLDFGSRVLFVSQQEIEVIGRQAESRRRIVDAVAGDALAAAGADELRRELSTVGSRIFALRTDLETLRDELDQLSEVPAALAAAEAEQGQSAEGEEDLKELQERASVLSDEIGSRVEMSRALGQNAEALAAWASEITAARLEAPTAEGLPTEQLAGLRGVLRDAAKLLVDAQEALAAAEAELTTQREALDAELAELQRDLGELNGKIETLQEGAGAAARRISGLRGQIKRREALVGRLEALATQLTASHETRDSLLDALSEAEDGRFKARVEAGAALADRFDGEIEVNVVKAGEVAEYEAALGRALEGSGLQWRSLAKQIAARMSPRELVLAVESDDPESVVEATSISEDRAQRLVSHLRDVDTTEILLARINEDVDFALLDGQDLKPTGALSMGQRCTVVLPLLLARDPDLAVLDQPEDHLDNAFIVDTVVEALVHRGESEQLLIATHNANIPVLGDADRVLVMTSSGRQAFHPLHGSLAESSIVDWITRLMEGGAEAFRRRAEFYGSGV